MIRKLSILFVSLTLVKALISKELQADKGDKQGGTIWDFKIVNHLTFNHC
ncbi:MAG: hypothetical protein PVH61_27520 [Candidatus Aminicenantes bacterium]|jgi:hypothetical protein